jgi:hypothetical protein
MSCSLVVCLSPCVCRYRVLPQLGVLGRVLGHGERLGDVLMQRVHLLVDDCVCLMVERRRARIAGGGPGCVCGRVPLVLVRLLVVCRGQRVGLVDV